jgi:hypothetical protein
VWRASYGTRVGYVVAILAVVVVVAIIGWAVWRRRSKPQPATPEPPRTTRVSDAAPMTGLEAALDQATDRSGRKMREKIEGTTAIDDLIVPEDTGPILRRALDQVEHAEPDGTTAVPAADPNAESPE